MDRIHFRAPFDATEERRLFRRYGHLRDSIKSASLQNSDRRAPEGNIREIRKTTEYLSGAFLPLVTAVAKKAFAANKSYLIDDIDELISAGYEGLLKAFDEFDPDYSFRFATYASWWIFEAVSHAVRAERWITGISDYRYREVLGLAKATRRLEQLLCRKPTTSELSTDLGIPLKKLSRLFAWTGRQTLSMDTPVGDGSSTIGDFIADSSADPPIVALENSSTLQLILDGLGQLTRRERVVIEHRFGLLGAEIKPMEEIAEMLDLTTSGIRYIQSGALEKLKERISVALRKESSPIGTATPPLKAVAA